MRANPQLAAAQVSDFQTLITVMTAAKSVDEGLDALIRSAALIGMRRVSPVSNLNWPAVGSAESNVQTELELLEKCGWAHENLALALAKRDKGQPRTSTCGAHARFKHLPFVSFFSDPSPDPKSAPLKVNTAVYLGLGLTGALVVPVRMARGRIGLVSWFGDKTQEEFDELLERHGPDLLVLAHYFFALIPGTENSILVPEDFATLSVREAECLSHAALGQLDREISSSLGISLDTVRFHIENAKHKLGGRTKGHTIALASQLGLIEVGR